MEDANSEPFWKVKRLDQMSVAEWESLCDGCGRCCLHKLRDDDTSELAFTNVACRLLNLESCACSDYQNRSRKVPDCIALTPKALAEIDWLPPSCAYRLVANQQELPEWHPLVTGDRYSVVDSGASIHGRAISETEAGPLEHHIVDWPAQWPKTRR